MTNPLPIPDLHALFAESLEAVAQIEEYADRANAHLATLRAMHEAGLAEAAAALDHETLDLILLVADSREQSYLLRLLSVQQAKRGLFESSARTFAYMAADEEQRDYAMREIGEQMAKFGLTAQAMNMAEQIEDLDDYEAVLRAVAERHLEDGQLEESLRTAALIEPSPLQIGLFCRIAVAFSRQGKQERAQHLLRDMLPFVRGLPPHERDAPLRLLAAAFQEIGLSLEAKSVAVGIADPADRAAALCSLAEDAATLSEAEPLLQESLKTARRIEDTGANMERLADLARRYGEWGDRAAADALFQEAAHLADTVRHLPRRVILLLELAATLRTMVWGNAARLADALLAEVREIIDEIEEPLLKTRSLAALAAAQIHAGRYEEAAELAEQLARELAPHRRKHRPAIEMPTALSQAPATGLWGTLAMAMLQETAESADRKSREKAAVAFFDRALASIRKNPDPLDRACSLHALAAAIVHG